MNTINLEWINNNRKKIFTFIFLWMILFGGLFFPIRLTRYIPLTIGILVVYYYIGYVLLGLYQKRPLLVVFWVFLFNSLGLSWRVLLEWGEYSMIRDLTIFNVTIYLLSIPLYTAIVYFVLQRLNSRNQNKVRV